MDRQDRSLKALTVLLRSSQSVQEVIKKDMIKYGVNPTEFAVLELLYHKGEQQIQHLGKKILLASSSITYVVDKLEKKGYVERKPSPTDRRVIHANITESGKAFMDNAFPKHKELIGQVFEELSEEEIETAIVILKKLGLHAVEIK
ncbi:MULTISPECIES: MarR family winged helix-turn-helix transcriptional regulator [Carnobacterium]|uniref:MarR family winged helix-turn-helix transcriptional regulator n=1 Tax=Carnobacterium antarcticum TaxID=2126436 RepID=A0ABW4NLM4_9LACT|nr:MULTISPECIES: MarR family transcriptional regulator [unclassified Carnobacterium]ALV21084.1 Transcriptional regulator, MarR [Carnobacterium sp. CP1]QQP71230.1 MarR family transcriptional regulator [Carnobacterium sp. CS13]